MLRNFVKELDELENHDYELENDDYELENDDSELEDDDSELDNDQLELAKNEWLIKIREFKKKLDECELEYQMIKKGADDRRITSIEKQVSELFQQVEAMKHIGKQSSNRQQHEPSRSQQQSAQPSTLDSNKQESK